MMNHRMVCSNTSARRITHYYHGSNDQFPAILVQQHVNQLCENFQPTQQSRWYHYHRRCAAPSKMTLYKKSSSLPLFSFINSNKMMLTNTSLGTFQSRHFTERIKKEVEVTTTTMTKQKEEQKRTKKKRQRIFIPSKAPVALTPASREFFKRLVENTQKHVLLEYQMSQTGEPRMVFTFTLLTEEELMTDQYETTRQEGVVSLELLDTEKEDPKPPKDAIQDGLLKLYVGQNAFLKVLGCVIDIHPKTGMPIVQDKYGNTMDPNA